MKTRFEKLPAEKRVRILEAAGREFAAHGYEGASIQRISEQAGISKGAVYYHFEDKVDLYVTVVRHYSQLLQRDSGFSLETLTAETYWDELNHLFQQQFRYGLDQPFWALRLTRIDWRAAPQAHPDDPMGAIAVQQWAWK